MDNATNIIICVVIAAFVLNAIRVRIKKGRGGCCGSGSGEVKVEPSKANKAEFVHSAVIHIEGMTCRNCSARIENAFNSVEGCFAKVSLTKRTAELFSDNPIDEEWAKEVVTKKGYTFVSCKKIN